MLNGDLSFVLVRPADQKLQVFGNYETLKLLIRGGCALLRSIFEIHGSIYKDGLSSTHSRSANMKRRAPACGMSSVDQPPTKPR